MRKVLFAIAVLTFSSVCASAQTADEIIGKYVKTIGGMDKIQAVKTLRRSGKIIAGGGFEIPIVEENKRPNMVRQDITHQRLRRQDVMEDRAVAGQERCRDDGRSRAQGHSRRSRP